MGPIFYEKNGNIYASSAYIVSKEGERELKELLRITVSFKKTTRDVRLYTYISGLEEQSDFVKDAVEHYLKYLQEKSLTEKS